MARIIKTHEVDLDSLPEFDRACIYNGLDTLVTQDVYNATVNTLDEVTEKTYEFSKALQGPVLEMRIRGVLVDQVRRLEVIDELGAVSDVLERQLDRLVLDGVGLPSFNYRSPDDLKTLFYSALGIPPIIKFGRPTTDRAAREKLEHYPFAAQLCAHINALTDIGKKINVLRTEIDPDGRIRTSYNIAGTSTGRFSSSLSEFGTGGNLQNVEEALRSIFIADPGYKFAKADAKSGESYCVGAVEWNRFGDGTYLDTCESGDIHTAVARMVWPNLGWTGDLGADKSIALQPFYRGHDYRFMCKKLGHGCLTPDHEVLTRQGWVPITDKPSEILIWNEVYSSFSPVEAWADYEHTGDLVYFEGNSISACMTPDHRIPFKKDVRNALWETTADQGPQTNMPLGDNYQGGDIEVDAQLIAAFMADGSQTPYGASFHFYKRRKLERLVELLDTSGHDYKVYHNTDGSYKVHVGVTDWPKHPGPFMFEWTEKCLRDFIEELKHWDGYIGETSVSISSTSREDLEWCQTFGRILGTGGQISGPYTSGFGSQVYRLQQNQRRWATGKSIDWHTEHVNNQRVLCPTVASSWFYTRRNGKIFVTGNSNYNGKPATLAEQAKLDIDIVAQFQRKYFAAFPAHQRWQQSVDHELRTSGFLTTLTGRRRWFFGRRTDPSTLREAIAYDPQGSLADIVNTAMLRIWRECKARGWDVHIVMHDHDALTFMYREEQEDEVVSYLRDALVVPVQLANGRMLRIPYDVEVGWNKGHYDPNKNPEGLRAYNGTDHRKRQPIRKVVNHILGAKHQCLAAGGSRTSSPPSLTKPSPSLPPPSSGAGQPSAPLRRL